jgi:hypothetical protein
VASDRLIEYLHFDPRAGGLFDHEVFESITNPGKLLILASWLSKSVAGNWKPAPPEPASHIRHRVIRVIRDYGMFDRREAPQFYPAIDRTIRE